MRDPAFWWHPPGLRSALLAPAAAGYGAAAARRMGRDGVRINMPVLCVGNFTLGGAGKTPTAIALAKMLAEAGERVFCLSRGYGGNESGPKRVDEIDSALVVGDEALLLSRAAPTIVSRDRVAGARLAQRQGASVVLMDDGLQNPSLAKDFTIAAIDRRRGIGNGKVFPAGPLRAPLATQLARIDALLAIGDGRGADDMAAQVAALGLPVFHGRLVPDPAAIAALKARRVLAFAGIGDPDKFFATAAAAGVDIGQRRAFPDHHRFTSEEAAALVMDAEHDGLALLTTEKDHARMSGEPLLDALAARVHVLPVRLEVEEKEKLREMVTEKVRR